MKGNWPDDKKNSAKTGGAVKADGCKPNQKSKDYGMTIQQSDMQMKVIGRAANGDAITMTSLDFLNSLINPARVEAGENPVENRHFIARIEDEIDDLGVTETFYATTAQGAKREVKGYTLNFDQMMLIGMRESKAVRRSVLAKLKELERQVASNAANLPDFSNPAAAARAWAEQYELGQVLAIENKQQQEQIHSLESLFRQGMTMPQFCKMLNGVNSQQVCTFFEDRGWLYNESRSGKRWRVASYARDKYLTEEQSEFSQHGYDPFIKFTPVLLQKGAVRIYQLYLKGELPMKKDWDGLFTQDKMFKGAA